jgi:hypothetical protein
MARQAVLLIHGIGEQRPMDSLRAFVDAVWTTDTRLHHSHPDGTRFWSKPYDLSQNFDLRRLTTAENRAGLRTDFFELYWAHLMYGTRLGHVAAWVKTLLLRWPWTVPPHLRLAYWVLIALFVFGLLVVYLSMTAAREGKMLSVGITLLITIVVVPLFYKILANIIGDAARYLHVAPGNVQRRHEIRSAGVAVLKSLHEHGYDRIIVVGHSLGSVIGYDILNHAWTLYNTDTPRAPVPAYEALTDLEQLAMEAEDGHAAEGMTIHEAQRRYFNELKSNQVKWRITDFVTLGSPLAHAEILLAKNAENLKPKFADRELPRCLPALERARNDQFLRRFSYPLEAKQRVPHHAAVFGPTRWTNLYFPCRLLVWGDMIGGQLRPIFGSGVRDIAVRTRRWMGFFSHTFYWRADRDNHHVTALRSALDLLDERR